MSFEYNDPAEEQDSLSSEKEELSSVFVVVRSNKNEENYPNYENNNSFNETEKNENSFKESEEEKKDYTINNKITEPKTTDAGETEPFKNAFPSSPNWEKNEEEDEDEDEDEDINKRIFIQIKTNNEKDDKYDTEPNNLYTQSPQQDHTKVKIDSRTEKLLSRNIEDNNSQLFDESNNKEISIKYEQKTKTKIILLNVKQRRKYCEDTIRKRVKSNVFKEIRKRINEKLKKILSKKFGFRFPQSIVTNMKIEINKKILEKTLKDLLSDTDFMIELFTIMNNNPKSTEKKIMEKNRKILNELKSNGNEELNIILNKKMKDIYEEFINSKQFQRLIKNLIDKGEYYFYIHNYIEIAKDFVNHYKKKKKVNENEKDKDDSEEDDGYESDEEEDLLINNINLSL